MHQILTSPFDYGGLPLKNRVIFAPTSMGLSEAMMRQRIAAIAAGGCAMIVLGDVAVGRHAPHSLHHKKGFAYYRDLCETAHREGALVCAQLHQSDSDLLGMLRYLPGVLTKRVTMEDLRRLLNQRVGPYISGLSTKRVSSITASFGPAAELAVKAGFDMVQVHGDRMCGSFCSSLFNRRTDCYGGSAENRARFAVEAVSAIRAACPTLPIDYKLSVRQENPHYGNAGILLEELPIVLPLLEQSGVTSWHVALANHGSLSDTIPPINHPYFSAQGCFLPYCDRVRQQSNLPICAVGGITSPDFAEEQLASGRIDCIAMSRQLTADPEWPNKVIQGRPESIRRCVRCNKDCLGGMQRHEGVHCIYDKGKVLFAQP